MKTVNISAQNKHCWAAEEWCQGRWIRGCFVNNLEFHQDLEEREKILGRKTSVAKSTEARKHEVCLRDSEKEQGWNRLNVPAESRVMDVEKVRSHHAGGLRCQGQKFGMYSPRQGAVFLD